MARQLCIETVALDVCRGSNIEVGEEVWSVLMSSLDEIVVVVSGEDLDDDDSYKRILGGPMSFSVFNVDWVDKRDLLFG